MQVFQYLFRNVNIDYRLLLLLLGYWGCLLVCLSVSVLQQIFKQSYQILGILNRDVNLSMNGNLGIQEKIEHVSLDKWSKVLNFMSSLT